VRRPRCRGHDGDVPRLEPGVGLEEGKELVVENLQLAHGAVAGMDLDRPVVSPDAGAGRPVLPPIPQVEDVCLETVEQAVLARLLELPHLVRIAIQEQRQKIPPLLAAGGQQAVAGLQVQLARIPVFDAPAISRSDRISAQNCRQD